VETSCRYLKPGRYHDEISILTHVDELEKKALTLKHTVRESKSNALLVEGFEKRICLDVSVREDFRALDIPDDIYAVLMAAKNR
jgi:acyl-CoA thioesterase FadM